MEMEIARELWRWSDREGVGEREGEMISSGQRIIANDC